MLLDITINKIQIKIGVRIVSRPLNDSGTNKNKIIRNNAPQIIDVIAAIVLAFFQYIPRKSGTKHPARTISNASINKIPGFGKSK